MHELFEHPQGSGTSRQTSRDIPDSSLRNPRKTNFRGRARSFRPPPVRVEDPHPTGRSPDPKSLSLCSFFWPETPLSLHSLLQHPEQPTLGVQTPRLSCVTSSALFRQFLASSGTLLGPFLGDFRSFRAIFGNFRSKNRRRSSAVVRGEGTWGHSDLEGLSKPKFRTEFPLFCRKKSKFRKKEGFIRIPPICYGPSSSVSNFRITEKGC